MQKKKVNLDHFLTSYARVKSTWIKDSNVRPKTMELLEENGGRKLFDMSLSNILGGYVSPGKGNESKNEHMGETTSN